MTQPDQQATAVGGEALQGRYEILAPISSGAMGAVYRARDRETGGAGDRGDVAGGGGGPVLGLLLERLRR